MTPDYPCPPYLREAAEAEERNKKQRKAEAAEVARAMAEQTARVNASQEASRVATAARKAEENRRLDEAAAARQAKRNAEQSATSRADAGKMSRNSWCGVPMKNGTISTARACDLEELCKDWVFYRKEIYKYAAQGNEGKAAEARRSFEKTNVWLSAYDDKDTTACLKQNGG